MYVRIACVLSAALIACRPSAPPPPPPEWTEADTVELLRNEWTVCLAGGRTEDACAIRVRSMARFLPPTIVPLETCGAPCNSNSFCNQGILPRCKVCNGSRGCDVSGPLDPIVDAGVDAPGSL